MGIMGIWAGCWDLRHQNSGDGNVTWGAFFRGKTGLEIERMDEFGHDVGQLAS